MRFLLLGSHDGAGELYPSVIIKRLVVDPENHIIGFQDALGG